jgi:hypothetical protein
MMEVAASFFCQKCECALELEVAGASFKDIDIQSLMVEMKNALGDDIEPSMQTILYPPKNAMVAQAQIEKALTNIFAIAGDEGVGRDFPLCVKCVNEIEDKENMRLAEMKRESELFTNLTDSFEKMRVNDSFDASGKSKEREMAKLEKEKAQVDAKLAEALKKLETLKLKKSAIDDAAEKLDRERFEFESLVNL